MDLVNYLNHSHTTKIMYINDGEVVEALTNIEAGEELLVNYGHIVGGMEGYK